MKTTENEVILKNLGNGKTLKAGKTQRGSYKVFITNKHDTELTSMYSRDIDTASENAVFLKKNYNENK